MLEQLGKMAAKKLGLVTRSELIAMQEINMLATSSLYQLWGDKPQRKASNKALVELFFGLVKILQPSLFIEAGAKMADTSVRARQYLPDARIVAFEASPDNFAVYSKSEPHAENRVEYLHYALSDKEGTIDFNIRTAVAGQAVWVNSGANSILPRADDRTEYKTVSVPSKRIDDFFAGCGSCALWVDVEGASKQVLTGAKDTLKKALVAIVEVEDYEVWAGQWKAREVIEAFLDAGLVPIARDFEYKGQYNVVFLRQAAFTGNRDVRQNIEFFYSELAKR
ncbi:FkbM family methyltransferase [Pseudaminobacter sp. 19-2017]|uniref:FkbM family methyltransferase n=1 Tax=Pseudaminobacter soli (ex Zhang et al. 2022) TaxID=2831468 RepID=A0A942I767_9HYPH|nr:FkbM family methyltransferase [Pseudaminobacter soli]MBS3648080.1 FkbM family methyltransferase [Pseudaminobacter soli]